MSNSDLTGVLLLFVVVRIVVWLSSRERLLCVLLQPVVRVVSLLLFEVVSR